MKDVTDRRKLELPAFSDQTLVTQRVASELREGGLLTAFALIRVPGGWVVRFFGTKDRAVALRAVKDGAARVFKSLDAAASAVEVVGFEVSALGTSV